jgi:hypothetical protein
MIASLHKKQQNLKQMTKHKFLNDKTEQQHFGERIKMLVCHGESLG